MVLYRPRSAAKRSSRPRKDGRAEGARGGDGYGEGGESLGVSIVAGIWHQAFVVIPLGLPFCRPSPRCTGRGEARRGVGSRGVGRRETGGGLVCVWDPWTLMRGKVYIQPGGMLVGLYVRAGIEG